MAVFLLATFASYCLLNLVPGDIIDFLLGETGGGDPGRAARRQLEQQMGLDYPIIVRYLFWLGRLLSGDFGRSAFSTQPVAEALLQRMPATLELVILSQALAIVIAVPLGVLSAYRPDRPLDRIISFVNFILLSLPPFVTGVVLLFVFAVSFRLLPAAGYVPIGEDVWLNLRGYILPASTVAVLELSVLIRVLRSDMITVLQEDYIAFARAKGLSASYILFRHALRPSCFNMLTVVGLQVGSIISASVITEQLFSIPGLGTLLIQSVRSHDEAVVQGVVTVMVVLSVLVNLIIDVLYAIVDPRVARQS
jgi:peptide/nickel transport system permease protein